MTRKRKGLAWEARLDFYFVCPDCGLHVLEGNPVTCPHQDGARAYYNPAACGPPINWAEIEAKCGVPRKGATVPKPGTPKTVPIASTQDLVDLTCPKGT